MLDKGSPFPDFKLKDQSGQDVSNSDFAGRPVVFYFYPKDDTSGCTVEACEFRDLQPQFGDVTIVGISPDDPKSHQKFVSKYGLNFRLLADTEHALAESCGVWVEKSMYGKKYMGVERSTFLVGPDGKILEIWRKVTPKGHAEAVMAALK